METVMMLGSVALVLVIVKVLLSTKHLTARDKRDRLVDFAAGLVATFCGVAWAIALTNFLSERHEEKVVTGLLRAANADVLQACAQVALYVEQDTVFSPKLSDFFVMNTKVPSPRSLDDVMGSEAVLRRTSPLTFGAIAGMRTLADQAQHLAAATGTPDDRRKSMLLCGASYFAIHHALESEIDWQEGRITALARDNMTRYWWKLSQNESPRPGAWREASPPPGSWTEFLKRPALRESLLEVGVVHGGGQP